MIPPSPRQENKDFIEKAKKFAEEVIQSMPIILRESSDIPLNFARTLIERGYMEGAVDAANQFNEVIKKLSIDL